uniref:Oxysterol binding protein like 2 n=1 Tax=Hucho hucho TaxID=62062 RepID=A0A4W5KR63_9TELE
MTASSHPMPAHHRKMECGSAGEDAKEIYFALQYHRLHVYSVFILCVCYRKTLPAPMISRRDYSVLGIVKKCIGMELSKITMPIMFNKPLSFLRRMPEYTEHTHLIHKACILSDSIDCICRTGKSFNPLLVETNELTRYCLGYRLISEQVSHHPPINTFHAQSLKQEFEFHGSLYPKLKFWGKSVEVEPKGTMTLELLNRLKHHQP